MLNHPKPNQTTQSHKPHENLPGKRSAGNPHAAFEEAGAGNKNQKFQFLSKHSIAKKIIETGDLMRQLSTLLKNANKTSEADLERIIGSDIVIKQAYEALNQFNWSEAELIAYEEEIKRILDNRAAEAYQIEKGREEGRAEGEAKGKAERNIAIAKNLLQAGVSISVIALSTGLSPAEIEQLKL